jgi:hypothetical protein
VVIRLSGREFELTGGSCTWYDGASHLIVEVGATTGGDWLRLTAPLSWLGDELPPGAGSTEAALQAQLGAMQVDVPATALNGSVSADLGRGTFDAGLVAGGVPLTGQFRCPEVIEGD